MKVAVLVAMSAERARIAELVSGGRIGPNEIVLVETGIGKVNAALGAAELIRAERPDCLVSTGVAGGLAPDLRVIDVVAAAQVAYHDVDCGPGTVPGQVQGCPPRFDADPRLLALAAAVPGVRVGLVASGDSFVSAQAARDAVLRVQPDAIAVEMESGALAQTCLRFGVPFLSLRAISDTPGADAHVAQYESFWRDLADRSFGAARAFLESLPETLPTAEAR